MTLGAALTSGRTENLNVLRLLLAAGVIVSHAWPLALGPGAPEPLETLTGHSLGGWAVALFFFLSGLLVTASAERRSPAIFWTARLRRIFPGLGVALLVTLALAAASGASPHPSEAAAWFLRALTLVSIEHRLEGAFAATPLPEIVNGPLWSLFHEVTAYALCWLFVALGGTRHRRAVLMFLAVSALAPLAAPGLPQRAATFAPLFSAFALGMAAHVFRGEIALRPALSLCLLPFALLAPWPLAVAVLAYASLSAALAAPRISLPGDYSFGLYIYGWPVAQACMQACPGLSPFGLAAASLLATLPLAIASWHLVECPAQARRPAAL